MREWGGSCSSNLNSNIEIHKFFNDLKDELEQIYLNSNIEIHKYKTKEAREYYNYI